MSADRPDFARERHPLQWNAQALWMQLEPLLPGLSVEVLARSTSTNTALLERARLVPASGAVAPGDASVVASRVGRRQSDTQPCLLVAEHQMAGRGRLGRGWKSKRGASLTFSLALPLAPPDWSGLSLAVGVALAEALQTAGAPSRLRLGLKWPNDLWLVDDSLAPDAPGAGLAGGRKLGGVLIETLAAGSQRLAVIGIGINVAPVSDASADPGVRYACLREIEPEATAPSTLARVALPLVRALRTFEREGFPAFAERYAALDLLLDEAVATTDPRALQGIARGIDGHGALRVETTEGLQLINSGDVSVRPGSAVAPAVA